MTTNAFRRQFLGGLFGVGASAASSSAAQRVSAAPAGQLSVREKGAMGDGIRMDTKAVQSAIDSCSAAGGGTVYFPSGRYLCGTIHLRSNVLLWLDQGAVILGSKNLADYTPVVPAFRSYTDSYTDKSLIYAEKVRNIGIAGQGTIDGQGGGFKGPYKVRPYLMRVIQCSGVSVRDVTLRDAAMWVQHYLACDQVMIRGIRVYSRCNLNNDGIDIDSCERVTISDCEISSQDDAIVLKSTSDRKCRDVTISNCVLSSYCNALKLGTESNGGFEDIAITNCTIYDTRPSGIAIEMVDGGALERVSVSNITMREVGSPIFIRLGNRARPFKDGMAAPGMGRLRDVIISNVQATGANRIGCSITGLPGHPVENVTLSNIRLHFKGGGTDRDANTGVPEKPAEYPEYSMFGTLPAYGFYCRHVSGLNFSGLELRTDVPDARPAIVCDDVRNLEVLQARDLSAPENVPAIHLKGVSDAVLQGCRAAGGTTRFVRLSGGTTRNVSLLGNDFTRAREAVSVDADVSSSAVVMTANRT